MSIQVSTLEYFPGQIFRDKSGPCEILNKYIIPSGSTDNQLVITAISGKRIRVIGGYLGSGASSTQTIVFKSASGGTNLRAYNIGATGIGADIYLPFDVSGHVETLTGEGLYVNNATSGAPAISIRYFAWTP